MFCPTCGSNQGEARKYCTVCGTNLLAVSQALSGGIHNTPLYQPPFPDPLANKREKRKASGVKLAIFGGGIVALKFFSFIFAGPFRGGSPFGFWTIVGFIFLAIGISKIISSRAPLNLPAQSNAIPNPYIRMDSPMSPPKEPVYSPGQGRETRVPDTGELEPPPNPAPSVTEDETRQLREYAQPRKFQ
ncbi:MAG: hypothetical protein L0220_08180 [Acidobacteria bacterium]|nr:hypothetical protein [Acidobacteriota bacterium]